jgi:hypothetical protein
MRSLSVLMIGLLVPLAGPPLAPAQDTDAPPVAASELVRKLGDPSFRVREAAERELIRRGATALTDVKRGTQDADLEIRRRSLGVLAEIQKSEVEVFLGAFLAGKEDPKAALPGWGVVRKVMGDEAASRDLYALLYKADKPLLETLERDPKAAAEQFDDRLQKIQPTAKITRLGVGKGAKVKITPAQQPPLEGVAAVLLIAAYEPTKVDANAFNRIVTLLGQPRVQQSTQWSHATRRLIEKLLAQKYDDPTFANSVHSLAATYGCTELIETRLRPATAKLIDAAAANPTDFNLFYRALGQAQQCNLGDLIDQKLRPAVRKQMEAAARDPVDFNRLNQLANCAQQIGGMDDELKPVLRPALTQLVKKQAEKLDDVSRLNSITHLARISKNDDLLEDVLRPAYRVALVKMAATLKDPGQLQTAYWQAQNLRMQEEIESILKPAAGTMIQSLVAKRDDPARLQQALNLAQMFAMGDVLRPTAQKLVEDIAVTTPDLERLFTVVQIARAANLPDIDKVFENQIKPAARKALVAAVNQPINAATISQSLNLAEQLNLKEVAPLALKAIQTKKLQSYAQGQAIIQVGRYGDKEAIPHLEALLSDKAGLGTAGINGTTIHTQVGDVALAALIHLSGQKFEDYDFPWARIIGPAPNPGLQSSPHCYGFENDAARQAAQKKWREAWAKAKAAK